MGSIITSAYVSLNHHTRLILILVLIMIKHEVLCVRGKREYNVVCGSASVEGQKRALVQLKVRSGSDVTRCPCFGVVG